MLANGYKARAYVRGYTVLESFKTLEWTVISRIANCLFAVSYTLFIDLNHLFCIYFCRGTEYKFRNMRQDSNM